MKKEIKLLELKRISYLFCVFSQSILLQLNNMSKNQQPRKHLGLQEVLLPLV